MTSFPCKCFCRILSAKAVGVRIFMLSDHCFVRDAWSDRSGSWTTSAWLTASQGDRQAGGNREAGNWRKMIYAAVQTAKALLLARSVPPVIANLFLFLVELSPPKALHFGEASPLSSWKLCRKAICQQFLPRSNTHRNNVLTFSLGVQQSSYHLYTVRGNFLCSSADEVSPPKQAQ